jgi:hypothetical protein
MAPVRRKRSTISLLVPFLIIALVFGVLLWNKYRASRMVNPRPHVQQPSGARTVVLFFVADGTRLAREARELGACSDTAACVRGVLDELFNGPLSELDQALPEGALVNNVRVEGDTAMVDVSRSFVDAMPSGSSAEMMAVYSIVNTICVNFPRITRVRITSAGDGRLVLGHLDLSDPLTPDYSLETPPQAPPAATTPSTTDTTGEKP